MPGDKLRKRSGMRTTGLAVMLLVLVAFVVLGAWQVRQLGQRRDAQRRWTRFWWCVSGGKDVSLERFRRIELGAADEWYGKRSDLWPARCQTRANEVSGWLAEHGRTPQELELRRTLEGLRESFDGPGLERSLDDLATRAAAAGFVASEQPPHDVARPPQPAEPLAAIAPTAGALDSVVAVSATGESLRMVLLGEPARYCEFRRAGVAVCHPLPAGLKREAGKPSPACLPDVADGAPPHVLARDGSEYQLLKLGADGTFAGTGATILACEWGARVGRDGSFAMLTTGKDGCKLTRQRADGARLTTELPPGYECIMEGRFVSDWFVYHIPDRVPGNPSHVKAVRVLPAQDPVGAPVEVTRMGPSYGLNLVRACPAKEGQTLVMVWDEPTLLVERAGAWNRRAGGQARFWGELDSDGGRSPWNPIAEVDCVDGQPVMSWMEPSPPVNAVGLHQTICGEGDCPTWTASSVPLFMIVDPEARNPDGSKKHGSVYVEVRRVGEKMLLVWRTERHGLRMRIAPPDAIATTPDRILSVAAGWPYRVFTAGRFALVLAQAEAGALLAFRIDETGSAEPIELPRAPAR